MGRRNVHFFQNAIVKFMTHHGACPPQNCYKRIFTENTQRKQENFKVFKAKRFRWNNLTATDRQTDRQIICVIAPIFPCKAM